MIIEQGTVSIKTVIGSNVLQDNSKKWQANILQNTIIVVSGKDGKTQARNILNNSGNTVVVDEAWTADIAVGSTYQIVESADVIRSTVVTLVNNITFNDVVTTYESDPVDCSKFRRFMLHLAMQSANTPTTIQFIPQFSPDGGITWHTYKKDEFVSLFYEDQDLATLQRECLSGECDGRLFRIRVVAVGTTAVNTFTATVRAEFRS